MYEGEGERAHNGEPAEPLDEAGAAVADDVERSQQRAVVEGRLLALVIDYLRPLAAEDDGNILRQECIEIEWAMEHAVLRVAGGAFADGLALAHGVVAHGPGDHFHAKFGVGHAGMLL